MRDEGKENKIYNIEDVKSAMELFKEIEPLKKEQQRAILWLLYHLNFLDLIDSGKIMTEKEEREWKEKAIHDNDYILMSLIQYKKIKDENRV